MMPKFGFGLMAMAILVGCTGSGPMKVIAHRGDSAIYPENTLISFKNAVDKKADLVELDSYQIKDGHLVVLHDSTLNRTTNAAQLWGPEKKYPVAERTLEELTKLDAGGWKNEKFKGEPLPTLEQAVRTINAGSVTLIERKGGPAHAYAKFLVERNLVDKVVVQAFDWDFLAAMHTWLPQLKLAALGGRKLDEEKVKAIKQTGATWAAWYQKDLDEAAVQLLRKYGLRIWSFTIDDEPEWTRLKALGIDGIITNKPAELRTWLARQ